MKRHPKHSPADTLIHCWEGVSIVIKNRIIPLLPYGIFAVLFAATAYYLLVWPSPTLSAMARPGRFRTETVVIDAGHGGEDGGAVSPAGNVESLVNLAVAQRLDQLLGLYGVDVLLLRDEDVSLHDPDCDTLRQKKVSDLKNRVAAIEATPNATLISIHQNTYAGSAKYHGAQVFYAGTEGSAPLAQFVQETLRLALDPENSRQATRIPDTVYLMSHITCRAILVECGFLSNPTEDALLQTGTYQTKLATALAGAYLGYVEPITEEEPAHES